MNSSIYTQVNGLSYWYQIVIIQFDTNYLFAHS